MLPTGVFDYCRAGISELLARLEPWLLADYPVTAHFLNFFVGVSDDPVSGFQLGGNRANVADDNLIRKKNNVRCPDRIVARHKRWLPQPR